MSWVLKNDSACLSTVKFKHHSALSTKSLIKWDTSLSFAKNPKTAIRSLQAKSFGLMWTSIIYQCKAPAWKGLDRHSGCLLVSNRGSQSRKEATRSAGVLLAPGSDALSVSARHHPIRNLYDHSRGPIVSRVWQTSSQKSHLNQIFYLLGIAVGGSSSHGDGFSRFAGRTYRHSHHQQRFYSSQRGHCTSLVNSFLRGSFCRPSSLSDTSFFHDHCRCCISRRQYI